MPEMTHPGKDHGQTPSISSGDDVIITHGTAGLNDCRGTGFRSRQKAVSKRKKRI